MLVRSLQRHRSVVKEAFVSTRAIETKGRNLPGSLTEEGIAGLLTLAKVRWPEKAALRHKPDTPDPHG